MVNPRDIARERSSRNRGIPGLNQLIRNEVTGFQRIKT